jgi:P4 family phage/plasmid primase-like protien
VNANMNDDAPPVGQQVRDQASLNGQGDARAAVRAMLAAGWSEAAITAELHRASPQAKLEAIGEWVAGVAREERVSPEDPGSLTTEQREQARRYVDSLLAAWIQRFSLKKIHDPIDPEALLIRNKFGFIDTYLTADFMLPRSDQLSGTRLFGLSGGLLHYGTNYSQWLAWDDESHVHSADNADEAGNFVQRYALAHAMALRLIQAQVEQRARAVTGNLRRSAAQAQMALKTAEQDPAVTPCELEKLRKADKLMAEAFAEAWAREMAVYGTFRRQRDYRDKLWGRRTKNDVTGELKTMLSTDMATFDANPDWLVCDSGVVEVRQTPDGPRFPLLSHNPARLVTKRLGRGVRYDWKAQCPAWEEFLASTVKDPADRAFLRRRIGAALAGRRVKDFLDLIGRPDTGKTTFNLVMKALFGSYFASPDVNVFMASGDPQPWDLDLCRGARYVYAAEPEPHSRFRDGMIKKLTGGDPVESARKYGHPVEWDPQCLLVFATNHPIFFDTSDAAMFGRAKPVEFTYSGPKDPGLLRRLLAELPGIFTWALGGLHEYLSQGAPEVTPAMARLRERIAAESDPALRFLSMAITEGYLAHDADRQQPALACAEVSWLYPKFTRWCAQEGIGPVMTAGKQKFNERIGRIYPQLKSGSYHFTGLLPGPRYREEKWS